jgi:hypothetical protein
MLGTIPHLERPFPSAGFLVFIVLEYIPACHASFSRTAVFLSSISSAILLVLKLRTAIQLS